MKIGKGEYRIKVGLSLATYVMFYQTVFQERLGTVCVAGTLAGNIWNTAAAFFAIDATHTDCILCVNALERKVLIYPLSFLLVLGPVFLDI